MMDYTVDENGAVLFSIAGLIMDHEHSAPGDGGPLAVGATLTDLTPGSVWFAGVGGVLQEDNGNLFWDEANSRLGIGTNAPDFDAHIYQVAANADLLLERAATSQFIMQAMTGKTRFGSRSNDPINILVANVAVAYFDTTGYFGLSVIIPTRRMHAMDDSASTGVIIPIARLESQVSGGAGAAGHGPALEFTGESSTTEDESMIEIAARWSVATHASRRARLEFRAAYIGTDVLVGVIEAPAVASADGNARGPGAADLQGYRNAVTQVASGIASFVVGYRNTASNDYAVAMGESNTVSGQASFGVGGGHTVSGDYSAGLGALATVTDNNAYVWACAATASWGANTWAARTHGGARFYSAAGVGTGVQLTAGGNAWAAISARKAKRDFRSVDNVLAKIAVLPIYNYALKSQSDAIRHIGAVAEEFNAIFGFTEAEGYINSMDSSGVALAAIKALLDKVIKLEEALLQ